MHKLVGTVAPISKPMDEGINLGSINSMDRDLGTNVRNVSFFVLDCEACCEVESCKVLKCAVCT